MKPSDKLEMKWELANNIIHFVAVMDMMSNKELDELAEWIKAREAEAGKDHEKNFLLAARDFVIECKE